MHTEAAPGELRITRLMQMLARLDAAGANWPRARLAAHYGVSERQITKDLAVLERALGITIRKTRTGYALDRVLGLPDPDGPSSRHPVRRDREARTHRDGSPPPTARTT